MTAFISIRRYLDVPDHAKLGDAIDAIFFEASNTKSFASAAARATFRERWLGRYLRDDPQFVYLAMNDSNEVAGYLVGAIAGPASAARFADDGYPAAFRAASKRYPAHLHVNLAPAYRGYGIGGQLIDAFVADARSVGASGAHVITSAASDNVRFYIRNGFVEIARTRPVEISPNDPLVFLGREWAGEN
jgi:ribosomal protein S18 acetylase RimI-like enzyme